MRVVKIDVNKRLDSKMKVGQWFEGFFVKQPAVGEPFLLNQTIINGKEEKGVFVSSPITKVEKEEGLYYTQYSVYKICLA